MIRGENKRRGNKSSSRPSLSFVGIERHLVVTSGTVSGSELTFVELQYFLYFVFSAIIQLIDH